MFGRRHELRALERSRWVGSLLGFCFALLGAAAYVFLPDPWNWGVLVGVVLVAVVVRFGSRWVVRRKWRELLRAERCRCVRCFQDLRGLGERGTCPECGERFILRETREEWLRVFQAIAQDGREEVDWDEWDGD